MVKKVLQNSFLYVVLLLMYTPIILLMIFSFTDATIFGQWHGFSLNLYGDLFKNPNIIRSLTNTILVALSAAGVSTILGTLGAIGIFYSRKRVKTTFNVLTQIPIVNAEVVTAISLTILFVFIVGKNFSFLTLLIGHVVLTVPFVILSVIPKLKQMDPNIYEAALDLGSTPKRALWTVVFPEILPGIMAGFILSITLSLDDYIITAFTKDSSYLTLSTYIYGDLRVGAPTPALRALGTIIFVVVILVLILINVFSKKTYVKKRYHKERNV